MEVSQREVEDIYKKKLVLLVDRLLLAFIWFEKELPKEMIMGLPVDLFIFLRPLSLLPSGKGWSTLEVKGYGLVGDFAHHF